MRVLWVATKAPWPPVDGGRLLMWHTLAALREAGVEVTLVAPVGRHESKDAIEAALREVCVPALVTAAPVPLARAVPRALLQRLPLSIARHALAAVRRRAHELAKAVDFAAAHAEQLQALPQCRGLGLPLVLRAQNVESALWRGAAREARLLGPALALEARRLERYEAAAVREAAVTIALTEADATRLSELAAPARVRVVPAPFPAELPAGEQPLEGAPALVLLGSGGWRPNEDAARNFVAEVWPRLLAAHPAARLHVFGLPVAAGAGVVAHAAPRDSRDCFPREAILVVPLRVGSGVRMKILEAWARGVPVVASPAAAAGLAGDAGSGFLSASTPEEWLAAVAHLGSESALRQQLVDAGRCVLREHHRPARIGRQLTECYGLPPRRHEQPTASAARQTPRV